MFCCLVSSEPDRAIAILRACSPRVARYGDVVVCDVTGCSRTIGPSDVIAREIAQLAHTERLTTRVAVAPTVTAAWLLAHASPTPAVVASGRAATALASVPIGWLASLIDLDVRAASLVRASTPRTVGFSTSRAAHLKDAYAAHLATFERWGLRTLGDIASLPRADLHARMGSVGVRLHQAARGEDAAPFVPIEEAPRFFDRMELEWPIDGLEPLAFVLARQCDRLSSALERADRGATVIRTRLRLVTRETHERVLQLPAAMRDARVLRTLIVLDLESHPPPAAIDVVEIDLDVIPGRIVQGSLVAPSLPAPEDLATLVARLCALMGDSRIGSPVLVDTHDPRAIGMVPFRVPAADSRLVTCEERPVPLLRRFRIPVAVRVQLERGAPVRVVPSARGLAGGQVATRAGPWRSSGHWWTLDRSAWDRDEWDVELADGDMYRLSRDRATGIWEIEGVLD